jgi:hypothetical protein
MKTLILISLLITSTLSLASAHLKPVKTKASNHAWSKDLKQVEESIWPYSVLSIGHSMQSYQNYSTSPYWHDGLDIRGEAAEQVVASVSGTIVNIENYHPGNHLYWEVAILDDSGFVWKYHHVDNNSIPKAIHDAYKNGTRITMGSHIGNIVTWPVTTYGEVYHHIHLLVVDGMGRYVNPFRLLPALNDTTKPVIEKIGLFNSRLKKRNSKHISGKHGIYVKLHDTVLHNEFKLTPYMISYNLDGGEEQLVWTFDYLPSGTNDIDYLKDFYMKGTCGNYNCRDFFININFKVGAGKKNTNFFELDNGAHTIRINAWDFSGNSNSESFSYVVE